MELTFLLFYYCPKKEMGLETLKPETIISKIYVFCYFFYHLVVIGSGILIESKCFCFSSIKNFNFVFILHFCLSMYILSISCCGRLSTSSVINIILWGLILNVEFIS